MIERSRGRYVSPIRLKNKYLQRTASPSNQSISSVNTNDSATSTPTQFLTPRRVQRHSRFNFDKEVWSNSSNENDENLRKASSSSILIESKPNKNEASRTNCGAYSVPYREKRNPLNNTRLSCYKPAVYSDSFGIQSLKNYKSVDDFLSMDKMQSISVKRNDEEAHNEAPKTSKDENYFGNKSIKRRGFSSKLRSMSDKTQKLFSKFYSSSNNLKSSSSEICGDFTVIKPKQQQQQACISRRSLSYGMLPDAKEFEVKKLEAEDGDSGILVNESGASSIIETESISSDKSSTSSDTLLPSTIDRKYVQR